jgi:hypothetical protein
MRFAWIAAGAGLLAVAACSPAAARPAADGHGRPHAVTVAREGRDRMELDVVSGATTVAISSANLGGELLRAFTPADSGVAPDLVVGDRAQLFLDGTGRAGPAALRIVLNSRVTWRLVFTGGASLTSVDLGSGRFGGADFAAGSALITMRLPKPDGTVTVVLAGGASQVSLSIPAGVAARLRLDGGASSATIGDLTYTGVAGGTMLTMPGWASAPSRYDIDAPAGVSAISVTSR